MWFQKIKNVYHTIRAFIANIWYGFPSKHITVIGITGTDGKTTTSHILYHILEKANKKVAMITTVGIKMGEELYDTGLHTTTPSPFYLQKYIKKIVNKGYEYLILEVTSHSLDQNRVFGIPFQIGILTNITREHLDYHKTYENYLDAKLKLLKKSQICILNVDDISYKFAKEKLNNKKMIIYSLKNKDSDFNLNSFKFITPYLFGDFNKQNTLAAIAAAKTLGVENKEIRQALLTSKPPVGREEIVYNKDFKIIIDFAHTPHSFSQVLPEISKLKKGKLIHVFGAAGERDSSKRPLMGTLATSYDDIIILTSEDPRSEKPSEIVEEIASGIDFSGAGEIVRLYKILDRQQAINEAVMLAKKGDIVLITGKGHERSMNFGNGETPWSEYEAVGNALQLKFENKT